MVFFDWITEQLVLFLATLGLEKESIKAAFEARGLGSLWVLIRDLYLNPYNLLLVFPLWLLLSRLWPAEDQTSENRSSLALDFLYPLFALPIEASLIAAGALFINGLFETYVPLLDTGLLDDQPLVVQTAGAFLIADFMFYVAHVIKHKVPWLWYFHSVHHSQRHLNLFTTHRNHPMEDWTNLVIKTVPVAIVGGSYPAWTIFLLVNNMWGYYIHANIRTNMGALKYVLVTPQNHRLHHTIEANQMDRNYGERLTVWDWIFGTLWKDFDAYPKTGVKECEWIEERTATPWGLAGAWLKQFAYPFWMIGRDVSQFFSQNLAGRTQ